MFQAALLNLLVLHSNKADAGVEFQSCELPSIHMQGVSGPGDTRMGVEAGTDGITVVWQG